MPKKTEPPQFAEELTRAFEMPRAGAPEQHVEPPLPDVREVMRALRQEHLGLDMAERVF